VELDEQVLVDRIVQLYFVDLSRYDEKMKKGEDKESRVETQSDWPELNMQEKQTINQVTMYQQRKKSKMVIKVEEAPEIDPKAIIDEKIKKAVGEYFDVYVKSNYTEQQVKQISQEQLKRVIDKLVAKFTNICKAVIKNDMDVFCQVCRIANKEPINFKKVWNDITKKNYLDDLDSEDFGNGAKEIIDQVLLLNPVEE
jgi:hypothetical protein